MNTQADSPRGTEKVACPLGVKRQQTPPRGGTHSKLWMHGFPDAPGQARSWAKRILSLGKVEEHLRNDVEVVLSELVTNSVRHSRSRDFKNSVSARLAISQHTILLVVTDLGPSEWSLPAVEPLGVTGFGLEKVVEQLAHKWGRTSDGVAWAFWSR